MFSKSQTDSIVKHLREIANILESSNKKAPVENVVVEAPVEEQATGSKRGRKPGAVDDDIRCTFVNKDKRCMNRATKGKVCGKHLN